MERFQAEDIDSIMLYLADNNGEIYYWDVAKALFDDNETLVRQYYRLANDSLKVANTVIEMDASGRLSIGFDGRRVMEKGGFVAYFKLDEKIKTAPLTANKIAWLALIIGSLLTIILYLLNKG